MWAFLTSAAGAFVGRCLAVLFIAIGAALGFGPPLWAETLIGIPLGEWIWAVRVGLYSLTLFLIWIVWVAPALANSTLIYTWQYRPEDSDWVPFRRLIPMKDATQIARDKVAGSYHALLAESFAKDGNNEGVFSYFAHAIEQNGKIQLYGKKVGSRVYERIPKEEMPSFGFENNGASIRRHIDKLPLFTEVALKHCDFYRRLKALKKEGG